MRPTFLVAMPALALVAQAPAPAPTDYRQAFNAELPGINQMLKSFQAKEAMAKAASLVPAQRPAFDGTNLQTIVRSVEQAQGLLSMYRLWASTAVAAGQWEKAQEIQEKRLATAQAIREDLAKAQQPIQALWDKAVTDGNAYIAKNQPVQADLDAKVKAFKAEFEQVQADLKSGKRKLTKQEADDINARGKVAGEQEHEAAQIAAAIKMHQDNASKAKLVSKYLNDNTSEVEAMVKESKEDLDKTKANIANQSKEISEFNAEEAKKKVKIVGNRTWVNAVLRNHENLAKLSTPQDQAGFLNRLLVLDPGNAMAEKALRNLAEGKDPFAKEARPTRKAHSRK